MLFVGLYWSILKVLMMVPSTWTAVMYEMAMNLSISVKPNAFFDLSFGVVGA